MPPALLVVMLVGFEMMTPPVIKQMRRNCLSLAAAASVGVMEIWVKTVVLAQNLESFTVKILCPVTSSPLLKTVPLAAVRVGLDKSARGVKTSAGYLATPLMKGGSNFAPPSDTKRTKGHKPLSQRMRVEHSRIVGCKFLGL
jgi:hypothetical protein